MLTPHPVLIHCSSNRLPSSIVVGWRRTKQHQLAKEMNMNVRVQQPESVLNIVFQDDGNAVPNSTLPLLVYKKALSMSERFTAEEGAEKEFDKLITANNWNAQWTWVIYDFTHFHSTAHEALAVVSGEALVEFGGPEKGKRLEVTAGDFVIIPAGVAHCRIKSSDDFRVIGSYPNGQEYDLRRGEPSEYEEVKKNIRKVPLPDLDPLYGAEGPLNQHWR
jgi:uncharacterized protein YjlB